jgi:hypothetical protein
MFPTVWSASFKAFNNLCLLASLSVSDMAFLSTLFFCSQIKKINFHEKEVARWLTVELWS